MSSSAEPFAFGVTARPRSRCTSWPTESAPIWPRTESTGLIERAGDLGATAPGPARRGAARAKSCTESLRPRSLAAEAEIEQRHHIAKHSVDATVGAEHQVRRRRDLIQRLKPMAFALDHLKPGI